MKVKAAVAWEAAKPLEIEEIGAGVIEEVGPGVSSLKPGAHVIPLYVPECRNCKYGLSGKTTLCITLLATPGQAVMPDGTSRISSGGKSLYHYMGTSTFAERTVLPEIAVAKIREDAPLDKVCLLACGVMTGIGAVLHTAKVEPGSSVAIFGLGGVGLAAIQGATMAGAERIIGIDTNPKKFELATQLGATECLNPGDGDVVEALVEMTDGGVDYSFECIGNVEVMGQALACTARGWGQSIIIGVAGSGEEIHARPFLLVTGRSWRGSAYGGTKGRTQVPGYVDRYMNGRLELDAFVSRKLPLEEINQAFELMHEGEVIRSVIEFSPWTEIQGRM
jgi:S-(hydroxymethyl)glutathione dehydrogenase/alcohol dehydrogenase